MNSKRLPVWSALSFALATLKPVSLTARLWWSWDGWQPLTLIEFWRLLVREANPSVHRRRTSQLRFARGIIWKIVDYSRYTTTMPTAEEVVRSTPPAMSCSEPRYPLLLRESGTGWDVVARTAFCGGSGDAVVRWRAPDGRTRLPRNCIPRCRCKI